MSKITVQLSTPVDDNGKQITELSFRRPTTGDAMLADSQKGEMGKLLAMLCGMAGISMPVAQRIDMTDFAKIVEVLAPWMGESRGSAEQTGST